MRSVWKEVKKRILKLNKDDSLSLITKNRPRGSQTNSGNWVAEISYFKKLEEIAN